MSNKISKTVSPNVNEYLDALCASSKYGPQVVYRKKLSEKKAIYDDIPGFLAEPVRTYLNNQGIKRLYSHQSLAINQIGSGKHVLVATPTASGKTFIYNLPILSDIIQQKDISALYLFPLKALARDQFATLVDLYDELNCSHKIDSGKFAAIFDGDSTPYQRQKIKKHQPNIILTNPEMLHLSMLPYHHGWAEFFKKLKYVVIDEVHTYRGVFGSHMAWVFRRLRRIASYYGAKTQFIMLSATVGNPKQFGELLINDQVEVITKSGAPSHEKNFTFLNPWDSPAYSGCQLLEASVKRNLRTIVYTQSRKMTELINLWVTPRLGDLENKLSSYRAGFLPEERREIEEKLFSGKLFGVISTSALELGIDIGDLDICILVGYPGSVMATMQRSGRVGRSMNPSAVILIGQEDALDQHFMRNPQDFFSRLPESAVLNPENQKIMEAHLHCCAAELTIKEKEELLTNRRVKDAVENLLNESILLMDDDGKSIYATRKYPQRLISLRGGGFQLSIINCESGEVVGEIDSARATKECHEGAVYLHRGVTWLIEKLDMEGGEIIARKKTPHFYTRSLNNKDTRIIKENDRKLCFGNAVSWGCLRVVEQVTGYQKINKKTQKIISVNPLDLEKNEFETEGLWLNIPKFIEDKLIKEKMHFMGAIHALEHAMISLFPLFVLCDRNDIGGISCPFHEQTDTSSIFIYDGYSGGVGLSSSVYEQIDNLLIEVEKVVASCECETGCPSCVHSPKCGSGNRPIDKAACLYLVRELIKNKGAEKTDNLTKEKPLIKPPEKVLKGLDVLPSRYAVFDLETKFSAEEVGGWHQIEKMGMSLGIVYDSMLDEYRTYLEDEVEELVEHLCSCELVVGFNNIRFDNRVLCGYGFQKHLKVPALDLLAEVKKRLGYRLSLDRLAEATLNSKKSADGLQALEWFKEGRIDLIQKYCQKDVEITHKLFLYGLENEYLLFFNKAQKKVRLPLELSSRVAASGACPRKDILSQTEAF